MFGAWHQALLLDNSGPKTEQQKPNQNEEAGQVHSSSVSARCSPKQGAQAVPATPMEMLLPLTLLGSKLSLSATNAFIISFKKTSLPLMGYL